ncbi:MAG: UDP-glucose 4-epimerase GalE [Sterolibacteriaceae bacterium]|nr:UDP-glucose 4-epimerase GalE [Candidatus Methylophosphatis haderslevensis]
MAILVTGGAGYIGSHTCVELLDAGEPVVVLDNFCNSSPESLRRVAAITGATPLCVEGDLRDAACLARLFAEHEIEAVIHFAGLKAVGESVAKPLLYYDNNVVGTIRLLEAMRGAGVRNLVFSSSATVYGDPQRLPLTEDHPLSATNAYGQSKLMIEEILRDVARSEPGWRVALLRYFNPVGAHKSGTIGEDPQGIPNNLMPFVAQVAVGVREKLSVFGADYPTPDGTGVRDYIHVVDLALGHLRALERLRREDGLFAVNLGTGIGYSVLDMVRAFEAASGRKVAYQVVDRRPGDIASCYADPSLALELLGWRATRGIDEMCADAWRWQSRNPAGFRSAGA